MIVFFCKRALPKRPIFWKKKIYKRRSTKWRWRSTKWRCTKRQVKSLIYYCSFTNLRYTSSQQKSGLEIAHESLNHYTRILTIFHMNPQNTSHESLKHFTWILKPLHVNPTFSKVFWEYRSKMTATKDCSRLPKKIGLFCKIWLLRISNTNVSDYSLPLSLSPSFGIWPTWPPSCCVTPLVLSWIRWVENIERE